MVQTSTSVQVPGGLREGRNDLELEALDADALLISERLTARAGTRTVTVTVFNAWGRDPESHRHGNARRAATSLSPT